MFEVSETVTCWISRDLAGKEGSVSVPAPATCPPRWSPHTQKPPSPGVTAHGHTAAAVGVPGTVGVPGEHTVSTGAVLHAVGWGQLHQLGAGAREEQLLPEKHRREAEPGPDAARGGGLDDCRGTGARSRKWAVRTSQSGKSEGWEGMEGLL